MEGYFTSSRNISLVVLLIDMRRPPTADDLNMISFLKANHIEFITVLTKADKLNKTERKAQTSYFTQLFSENGYLWLPVSAVNGESIDLLREIIEKHSNLI